MKICIASNNSHKIFEFKQLLPVRFKIQSLAEIGCSEEIPEEKETIEENSLQKAEYIWENYKVNCFSDDTGLELEVLDNAPGVYSAMYAGPRRNNEENIDLLLKNLSEKSNRNARFRTVITLIMDGKTHQFEGIVAGRIVFDRRGQNGFGYDSIFEPEGYIKTFAEMGMDEKNLFSHRSRAIEKLIFFLENF